MATYFMTRFIKASKDKIGMAPGELSYVGVSREEEPYIEVIYFTPEHIDRISAATADRLHEYRNLEGVVWINVVGVHDPGIIRAIGDEFALHPLVLEDIMHTGQFSKFEDEIDYLFIISKMLRVNNKKRQVESEQVSMIVAGKCIVTFQEAQGDVFDGVRNRLFKESARIRKRGADYLAYALMDAIVDNYVIIIEQFGERIETLENELMENPNESQLQKIRIYKREINFLRKTVRPVRELASQFHRSDNPMIAKTTKAFVSDLVDHVQQCSEAIEAYYEMLNDMLGLYNMTLNNRLNDIIRVLTIFSVIFIPLTFLAGIYGTNFDYIPELGYRYAYPIFWAVLIVTAILMLFFFKRKRWL